MGMVMGNTCDCPTELSVGCPSSSCRRGRGTAPRNVQMDFANNLREKTDNFENIHAKCQELCGASVLSLKKLQKKVCKSRQKVNGDISA